MNQQVQAIWTDLHQELRKFIFSKIKDQDTTEDILQDVFLKIHRTLHTLSDSAKLTSWVYQITRNTVADYYRTTKTVVQPDGFDFAEQEAEESLYLSLSNCINQKISKLPLKYRQAVLLTYFDNYSQTAVAEALNISYSGAKTRVQRGREKLKDLIVDCKNVETDSTRKLIHYQNPEK